MYGKIDGLTPKQAAFVQEYLLDLNATQAAIRAGYSRKRASETAYQLLQKTTVSEAIQKAQSERAKRVTRQADDVLRDIYETGQEARARGQFNATLKALELEGRHIGMFKGDADNQEAALAKLDEVLAKFDGNI